MRRLVLLTALSLTVAGCGGDDGGDAPSAARKAFVAECEHYFAGSSTPSSKCAPAAEVLAADHGWDDAKFAAATADLKLEKRQPEADDRTMLHAIIAGQ